MKLFANTHKKIVGTNSLFIKTIVLAVFLFSFFSLAKASFTSTSFELENPSTSVISGGQSSSSSFQYLSATGQINQGQSTSTTFSQNAGFLYFPTATSPVVTVTPGDGQVTLVWTASTGIFANITSYSVGVSTSSGGVFTYTDVGNVTTSVRTGLTNSTLYYFKIRSFAADLYLSESAEVTATPVSATTPTPGPTNGGGPGPSSQAKINFSGRAYPNSSVTLLKDGQIIATTFSASDASFNVELNNVATGSYVFGVYSADKDGVRSPLQSFPITITSNVTINVAGIFIAPTISGDKAQVKQGDNITFFGQSVPESEVTISVHSNKELFKKVKSDKNGVYLQTVDTSPLEIGKHNAKSKVAYETQISAYSNGFDFLVGNETVDVDKNNKCPAKGDVNNDCKVNLVDFSIVAFWYKKPSLSAQVVLFEKNNLNSDGKINLVDFSILAYYWTG